MLFSVRSTRVRAAVIACAAAVSLIPAITFADGKSGSALNSRQRVATEARAALNDAPTLASYRRDMIAALSSTPAVLRMETRGGKRLSADEFAAQTLALTDARTLEGTRDVVVDVASKRVHSVRS